MRHAVKLPGVSVGDSCTATEKSRAVQQLEAELRKVQDEAGQSGGLI
jgi:hypothetical protein